MNKIFLATNNQHKVEEVLSIAPNIDWKTPKDFSELNGLDPEETGETFKENAKLKARAFADKTGMLTVAEDSGLVVDVLDGRPGVYSARWVSGTDHDRNIALLEELKGEDNRSAKYMATLCVYDPETNETNFFTGEVKGKIAKELKGDQGFGYDPLFIPDGYEQTFGELGESVKSQFSHRKNAFVKFLNWFKD